MYLVSNIFDTCIGYRSVWESYISRIAEHELGKLGRLALELWKWFGNVEVRWG